MATTLQVNRVGVAAPIVGVVLQHEADIDLANALSAGAHFNTTDVKFPVQRSQCEPQGVASVSVLSHVHPEIT